VTAGVRAGRETDNRGFDSRALSRHSACARLSCLPDHTEKRELFDLLQAEKNAGIHLTENFAMSPAASVSGLYFGPP